MQYSTFAAGILAIVGTASAAGPCKPRAVCNADNCARLVTGTRAGLPSTRLADCSSFQTTTVTGPATTSTVTVTPVQVETTTITTFAVYQYTTVTATKQTIVRSGNGIIISTAPVKRDVPTNTVPMYAASSCPASRYASACSCAGVTGATSTVSGSTTTVTVTAAPVKSEVLAAASTTVVSTAVDTAFAPGKTGYTCGSTVQGNGIYSFRRYRVNCGQRVTSGQIGFTSNQAQEPDCLRICNSIKYCVYAEYAFSTGRCDLYYQPPTAIVDDDDVDALILV